MITRVAPEDTTAARPGTLGLGSPRIPSDLTIPPARLFTVEAIYDGGSDGWQQSFFEAAELDEIPELVERASRFPRHDGASLPNDWRERLVAGKSVDAGEGVEVSP